MEGAGDADRERDRLAMAGGAGAGAESSAAEGEERARYSLARCVSQSSLDESSQRAAGGAGEGCAPAHRHAAALLAALSELRAARHLCDVRLRAGGPPPAPDRPEQDQPPPPHAEDGGGGGVWAHRAVLAACSPYFRAMFTQFDERTRPTVTIQNVEAGALEAIVEYMYAPESLEVREDNVQGLLSAASLMQVGGVRAACCGFLAAALAPDNALGIRAFADMHACQDLAAAAAHYIDAHAAQVLETEEFLGLSVEALGAVLDSDRLTVPGEHVVLDAVLRWAQHDPARLPQLGAALEHVRLPLVQHETLVARAAAEPLAGAGLRVKDLVIEALSLHLLRGPRRAAAAALCPRARPRHPPRAPRTLLVVGGQAPKAIRDVEALRLDAPGGWRPAAELPARRCRAGLAAVGGKVYAVGGFNGTLRVRSVDVYDVAADCWAAGPPLSARRSTLGVAVIDDRIYAVGGFDGATGLSSGEVLDVGAGAGGAWRPIAPMSTRRSSVGVAALNGKLYAVGGYDGAARQCLHTVERYDPAADQWEAVADMAARRSGAGVGVLGDALYAVGGHDGPAVRRSVERYREGGAWEPTAAMTHARRNAGVAAHAGKLYVVGGDDGAANLATVEVYDPATEAWTMIEAPMAVARSYAGVAVVERGERGERERREPA